MILGKKCHFRSYEWNPWKSGILKNIPYQLVTSRKCFISSRVKNLVQNTQNFLEIAQKGQFFSIFHVFDRFFIITKLYNNIPTNVFTYLERKLPCASNDVHFVPIDPAMWKFVVFEGSKAILDIPYFLKFCPRGINNSQVS